MRIPLALALLGLAASPSLAADMPVYEPQADVEGTLRASGSNTMELLFEAWGPAFAKRQAGVALDIASDGTATAPPGLTAGEIDFAPMSRPMTKAENEAFQAEHGHQPLAFTVALDGIAVIVHEDNPVQGLTLTQLDGIFSSTHRCKSEDIVEWDDLAVGLPKGLSIALHGRSDRSGTQDIFRERALCGGDFKPDVTIHATTEGIVEAVSADPAAIGYVGLGYRGNGERALALGTGQGLEETRYFPFIVERYADSPDPELKYAYIYEERYPLSRPLLIYVNKPAGQEFPAPLEDFLRFVLSAEGQEIVETAGFVPLSATRAIREREKLEPDYEPDGSWLPWR